MEKPFYGRTGLLQSSREGLPVERWRLLPSGAPGPSAVLKWSPTLLNVPQLLLHHIVATNGAVEDAGFSTFLRVAAVAEAVCQAWPGCDALTAVGQQTRRAVMQSALQWAAARRDAAPRRLEPYRTEWYLPQLKLLTMKEGSMVAQLPSVSSRAVTLFGKDHTINDVALDHPSCSAQHAAMQIQFVYAEMAALTERVAAEVPAGIHGAPLAALWSAASATSQRVAGDASPNSVGVLGGHVADDLLDALWRDLLQTEEDVGDFAALWTLELQVVDLMSTNGTFINGARLPPCVPSTLIDGDVVTFGASSRQYVLLRAS